MHRNSRKGLSDGVEGKPGRSVEDAPSAIDRRQFVRSTGGILVGVAFAIGCGEESGETGTVRLLITGLGAGATSGGSATITGVTLPAPIVVDLPPAATAQESVPVGTYSVSYTPPAGYAMATGASSIDTDVVVTVGAVTDVTFALQVAAGTIRTVVSGMSAGVTSGGAVQILRVDIPNQTATDVVIPVSGTVDTSVVPGTYRLTYAAPGGYRLAGGQQNPRDVAVALAATVTSTFAVELVPPASGIVFHSDWSTALGSTATAFRDTSKANPWDYHCCDSNTNTSIVTASSLALQNWPAANVYRVGTQASSPSSINTHVIETDLGVPTVGSHRYYRYYLQVTHGDIHGNGTIGNIEHGVETAESGGGDGMNFYRIPRNNGTWFPCYREIATGVRYVGISLSLLKNKTYRLEWHLAYGATAYTIEVRIFDELGALVATENDFHRYLPSEDVNIRLGSEQFSYTAAHHRFFRVGTNGPTGNFPMTNLVDQNLFLHGAVAVSESDWCGEYANGI